MFLRMEITGNGEERVSKSDEREKMLLMLKVLILLVTLKMCFEGGNEKCLFHRLSKSSEILSIANIYIYMCTYSMHTLIYTYMLCMARDRKRLL